MVGAGAFRLLRGDPGALPRQLTEGAAWVLSTLPPREDPSFAEHFDELGRRFGVRATLFDARGEVLASAGLPLPDRPPRHPHPGWDWGPHGPVVVVPLAEGGWLTVATPPDHAPPRGGWVVVVLLLVTVAVGTVPLARGITRRVEELRGGVERMGSGDLGARVTVRGEDEVAALARAFNASAARIEALVEGQRRMVASASHELRSPLARLGMALELLAEGVDDRERLLDEARRDIAELDQLVGDLLLSGRLQARARPADAPEVELGALVAAECARVGARWGGGELRVRGDAGALGRLVRNLLENGQRYASEVEARLTGGELVVEDRGPGVPPAERERIFEPFYQRKGHAEGRHGGVGLGLALVREIAAWHGAKVRYEAREGGGSRFVVAWG